jgi:hypothetical protein
MRKHQLYKVLFFLLIIVLIDRSLGLMVSKLALKYKFDRRIELLINNQIDKDILVLGSSKALNGIDPQIIENKTGKSCYNLSYSGSNIEFHETILDLIILSKNHPSTLIYCIDDPGSLIKFDGIVVYRKEELYPFVYNNEINNIVSQKLDKSILASKISSVYHQNVNLVTAIKYLLRGKEVPDYEINNVDNYGANIMIGHQAKHENMKFVNRKFVYDIKYENVEYRNAFTRILAKCKENNINVKLIITPSFVSSTIGFRDRISELSKDTLLVYDYSNQFTNNELFYNYEHLNKNGATKFTSLIADELNL